MKRFTYVVALAVAALGAAAAAPRADAGIGIGIDIGAAPVCPYGYYDYAPYACAPYGYYGPEWFSGGVFVGAGPWFHGPAGFHGHVDGRFDPRHGFRGPLPNRGDHADPGRRFDHIDGFRGSEMRDGHGGGRR